MEKPVHFKWQSSLKCQGSILTAPGRKQSRNQLSFLWHDIMKPEITRIEKRQEL